MDPITMSLILLGVGTGMNAYGQHQQGEASADAARYNAEIDLFNAQQARVQGQVASEAQARQARKTVGSMVANYGASGVQVDTGSPMDVLVDSARQAALDNLTIKYNAEMQARNYETQADLAYKNASASHTAGNMNAFSSLFSGFGKMLGM